MKVPRIVKGQITDRQLVRSICTHEAGHYVIARAFGFQVYDISASMTYPNGHSGSSEISLARPIVDFTQLQQYLESRIQIIQAGVIAESTNLNKEFNLEKAKTAWHSFGGAHDHAKIRELLRLLRNVMHPTASDPDVIENQIQSIENAMIAKTLETILDKFEIIQSIAQDLSQKMILYDTVYTLTQAEIETIPGIVGLKSS